MSSISISRFVLCSFALASAWARNVYVMPPNDGVTRTVSVFSADPFTRIGTVQAAPDAYTAISLASGAKTYIIGRSATQTVTVINNSLTVTGTLNAPGGSTDAALSPDGRRLILVSSNSPLMTIIDTTSDTILLNVNLPGPAVGVSVALDGSRAYALVPTGNQAVSVDLFNFQVSNVPLPSEVTQASGIVTGPTGYIYATAVNRLFEIDPRTNALTPNGQGLFNGSPGRPSVTPDGTKVLIPILNPGLAQSSLTAIDLTSGVRVGLTLSLQGVLLDRVRPISGAQALAYSTSSGLLYNVNLAPPLSATPVSFAGLPNAGLGNLVTSGEIPAAQFGYVAQGNSLYRLAINAQSQTAQSLPNNAGPIVYTGPASTAAVANLLAFNGTQLVSPTGTPAPLVVRAADAQGFPVSGATINFATSNTFGATVSPASSTTNGEGFAQAIVTLPTGLTQAQLPFTASTVSNLTQIFVINIGSGLGGGGSGATGKVVIIDGNGLLVKSNSPAPQDMRVRVVDSANNPVPNVTITWNITSGGGELLNTTTTVTDTNGVSVNRYRAKLLFGALQSYEQALITASTSVGTVTFTQVQIPDLLDGSTTTSGPRLAPPPNIFQIFPEQSGSFEITGPIGGTVKGVLRYQVRAGSGPLLGQGIPGVGVSARTGFELSDTQTEYLGPVATCAQDVVSDSSGVVACDLTFDIKSKLGVADPLIITVGGLFEFRYSVRMTVGPPARIIPAKDPLNNRDISGDGQAGRANTPLALPLTAQLRDVADNLLPGAAVRWEVISGNATLTASVNRADIRGLVSTGVLLGNNPGQVRIRVSSVEVPSANFVFTATVDLAFGAITAVSGDNQAATVQTAFGQPLIVRVTDTQQRPIPGLTVNFSAPNGGLVVPATAQTDSDGRAQVSVNAGGIPGTYTVTAAVGNGSVSFTLSVRALGPVLTSVTNSASNNNDGAIAPCALVSVNGTNIVPTLNGTRTASSLGRLPFTLEGVSITVNGISAPIQSVTGNGSGTADSVIFQAPCELLPGTANVTVRSSSLEPNSITVRVAPVAPGIYEEVDSRGQRRAVVLRPSGAQASATNPAEAGERVRILATGLGLVAPNTATNEPGSGGQIVLGEVVIGLNNEGVAATAEYAPGFVGVYFVNFTIPTSTLRGTGRPLVIAATGADGVTVYSAPSSMDVR